MKTTFLLLSPKIKSAKNSITINTLLKRLPFIFIGFVFWLLFYIGTYKVLNFIREIYFFGEIISRKLLSIIFFSLGIFLLLSNIITALSSFYISKDIPFLMSKPVRIQDILRLKAIETISSSSWMVISFIPPFFIAYGINYNVPFYFYLMLILTFIPFILISGGLGIAVAHLLTRIFSAKRLRLILLAIGLILFLVGYLWIASRWYSPESPEQFINALLSIKVDSPYLPSFWITESVAPILKGQSPELLYPLVLLITAIFMLILSSVIGNWLYPDNIERIQPSIRQKSKPVAEIFYPNRNSAFLWKDIKIFFRDAGQWSQLFIIIALIFIYVYNFRSIPVKTISGFFPLVKEFMALVNMLLAGLVLSAVSARFLYASISLEGMAFWIIRTSPVTAKKFLISKFLYGFIPVTVIMSIVVLITNLATGINALLMILSLITIFILCVSVSGLGIGMGAIYPNFRHENIVAISMSPGGLFFMLIAFLIVLLTVSIEAWSFYIYKRAELSGIALTLMEKSQIILGGILIIILNSITFYIPMKMGRKRLEEDLSI
ncbi:MAG: hypothetical protein AB1610_07195 [Nitrospirota bacterium]